MSFRPLIAAKVAVFVHERIWPVDCGFHRRCWQVLDALQELGAELHVVASSGPRPARGLWRAEAQEYLADRGIRLHLAPFHVGSPDFWLAAVRHLCQRKWQGRLMASPGSRYYHRPQLESLWRKVLRQQAITAALVNYANWHRLVRLARQQGVWTALEMHELLTDQFHERETKLYGRPPTEAARREFYAEELTCLSLPDVVFAINAEEGAALAGELGTPIEFLPYCLPSVEAGGQETVPSNLLVVGSFIEHNKRGLRQFLEGAWPEIQAQAPGTRLQICGRVGEDIPADDNIRVTLNAPDLTPYYLGTNIALLTTVTGAGIKIKTIEALAHGCCIVAHEHSVKGVPFENGRHGEVLTNLRKAAPTILRLLARPEQRAACQAHARQLFREHFDVARGREILARTFSVARHAPSN